MSEKIRMADVRPGDTLTVYLQAYPEPSTRQVLQVGPGSSESTVLVTFADGASVEFAKDDTASRVDDDAR